MMEDETPYISFHPDGVAIYALMETKEEIDHVIGLLQKAKTFYQEVRNQKYDN